MSPDEEIGKANEETGRMTKTGIQDVLDEMVGRIVERFHPDMIIVFGSYARGEPGLDSDVDLLVVMPVEGSKREARLAIRRALHDIRVPKDVVVSKTDEFAWRKEIVGTIEYPAAQEGEVLYAKP